MTDSPYRGRVHIRLARRQRGALPLVAIILIAVIVLPVAWTLFTLNWSYSEGERAGVVQKFSRKGWLCKTYEGELAQYIVAGVAPQIWSFTVRDEQVAAEMRKVVGSKVLLHYTEHLGVPTSCFGDTGYYVDGVIKLDLPPAAIAPPPAPSAAPPPSPAP
jgi:hypothetical protein